MECNTADMFLLYVTKRMMSPPAWVAAWRLSMKRERMQRRLLDWNHKEYAAVRLPAE
jgi:hypothetical protein